MICLPLGMKTKFLFYYYWIFRPVSTLLITKFSLTSRNCFWLPFHRTPVVSIRCTVQKSVPRHVHTPGEVTDLSKLYGGVHVCVCTRACVCCVRACVSVRVCWCVCVCMHVLLQIYPFFVRKSNVSVNTTRDKTVQAKSRIPCFEWGGSKGVINFPWIFRQCGV